MSRVPTGVPRSAIVKAAQFTKMSQDDVDLELAALEAQVASQAPAGAEEEPPMASAQRMNEKLAAEEPPMSAAEPASEAEEPAVAAPSPAPASADKPAPAPAADTKENEAPAAQEEAAAPASGGKMPAVGLNKRRGMAPVMKKSVKGRTAPPAADEAAPSAAVPTLPVPVLPAVAEEEALEAAVQEEEDKENTAPSAPAAEEEEPAAEPAAEKEADEKPAAAAAAPVPKLAAPCKLPGVQAKPAAAKLAAPPPKAAAVGAKPAAAKGPKKPSTAYNYFAEARRDQVKAEHEGLDTKGVNSKLGELFKALSQEGRAPYKAQAAADKARYEAELEAAGRPALKEKKGKKGKHTKTAYQLYQDQHMPDIKKNNPKAGFGELNKLVAADWKIVSAEEKAELRARAKELKEAAAAAAAKAGEEAEEEATTPKKRKATAAAGGPSRKKGASGKKAAAAEPAAEEEDEWMAEAAEASPAVAGGDEDSDDDEAERMNCDWVAHPPEMILSETSSGKYLVARQGLGLDGYGLVDVAAVKQQRLGGEVASCPVSVAMLDEYEAFKRGFKLEVHGNTEEGGLVLDDLPKGSLLEACLVLGRLQEPTYELAKPARGDRWLKTPLLGLSKTVQRFVMVDRQRADRAKAALQRKDAELQRCNAERDEWRAEALALRAQVGGGSAAGAPAGTKAAAATELTPRRMAEA